MTVQEFAKDLVGETCVALIGGVGAGSTVGFGFGERLRRVKALDNPQLCETDKKYASEYELTIYCAWRFGCADRVCFGWRDASDREVWSELRSLIGRTVVAAKVYEYSIDLSLEFEGDIRFDVLCDVTNDYESDDNYLSANEKEIASVGFNYRVSKPEKRTRVLREINK